MTKKIGRNDPCLCGSGKKYKKCCGATIQGHVTDATIKDDFKVCRDIAYKGKIGEQRENFCINYIEYKKRGFKEIESDIIEKTKANDETITCHRNCSYCCTYHLRADLKECEAIVYYLYQKEEILSHFIGAYPEWREKVGKIDGFPGRFSQSAQLILDSLSIGEIPDDELIQAAKREIKDYSAHNIPCPLLLDGICSVYEVRPLACAGVWAVTPPEYCNPLSANSDKSKHYVYPHPNMARDLYSRIPFYYKEPDIYLSSTMPLLVYEILKGGYWYLSDVPRVGLEHLAYEIENDPIVRLTMKQYGFAL